jgi:hypothetical protein
VWDQHCAASLLARCSVRPWGTSALAFARRDVGVLLMRDVVQAVYMHKTYLPPELYSEKEAKASLQKRSSTLFNASTHNAGMLWRHCQARPWPTTHHSTSSHVQDGIE